jgi:1-acyl-sn-glycerol-3-phosphate acyltransferase
MRSTERPTDQSSDQPTDQFAAEPDRAAPLRQGGPVPVITEPRWEPPRLWLFVLWLARGVIPRFCRLRITGDVPEHLRDGPLIMAGNHISNFDPLCITAVMGRLRIAPRMMATGGLFRAPVVGAFMTKAGHIPVDRGSESVTNAVPAAVGALAAGSVVFIYPEGRIGLDPGMWPERAKTGMARLALATRVPVIPVATWGSHEVIAYHGRGPMLRSVWRSFWRRPVVRVHVGAPVDLSDLRPGAVGHAQRASDRIMEAISTELTPLRADEPRLPRFRDRTRPLSVARRLRRRGERGIG